MLPNQYQSTCENGVFCLLKTNQEVRPKKSCLQRLITQLSQQMSATQLDLKELSREEVTLNMLASNINECMLLKKGVQIRFLVRPLLEIVRQGCQEAGRSHNSAMESHFHYPAAHERYTSFIPKQSNKYTFSETIEKLQSLFGLLVSIFHRWY